MDLKVSKKIFRTKILLAGVVELQISALRIAIYISGKKPDKF